MRHRANETILICSLAIFFVTGVLWLRDLKAHDSVVLQWARRCDDGGLDRRGISVASSHGRIAIEVSHRVYHPANERFDQLDQFVADHQLCWMDGKAYLGAEMPRPYLLNGRPFQAYHIWNGYYSFPWSSRGITMPDWFILMIGAAYPATRVSRLLSTARRRRRFQLGLCVRCGYDLRATPDHCPECGLAVADHPPAKHDQRA